MKLCARTSTSYDPLLVRRRRSWCWSTTTAPSRKLWWLPPGILQHPPRPASFFYYKPAPPLGPQWNPRVRLEPPSLELPFPRQPEHLQIGPASHEMGGRDDCRSSSRGRALAERNITVKCP